MKTNKNFKRLWIFAIAATMCLVAVAVLPTASASTPITVTYTGDSLTTTPSAYQSDVKVYPGKWDITKGDLTIEGTVDYGGIQARGNTWDSNLIDGDDWFGVWPQIGLVKDPVFNSADGVWMVSAEWTGGGDDLDTQIREILHMQEEPGTQPMPKWYTGPRTIVGGDGDDTYDFKLQIHSTDPGTGSGWGKLWIDTDNDGNLDLIKGDMWSVFMPEELTFSGEDLSNAQVLVGVMNGNNPNNPAHTFSWSDLTVTGCPACVDEVWVDDSWTGTPPGTEVEPGKYFGFNAFDNIQDGIDAVCVGGTVYVADGNYNAISSPFVRITKSLTLDGESRDGVILDGTGTSTIGWAKGIHVTAEDVTIKDLTVQNFGAVNYWGYGVVFRDYAHDTPGEGFIYYDGCTVENVKSQDNCYPMYAFCFTHLTVSDCLIQNNLGDGMFIAKGSADVTITGNTVLNSGDHGIWVGGAGWCGPSCPNAIITNNYVDGAREGGISFVSSDTALISDNTVTNAKGQFPGAGWSVGAISLKDGCSNVVIRDNLIYENDIVDPSTDSGRGIGIDGTSFNIDILCNIIRDNDGDGVWVSGTITGFQCNHNNIHGNAGYGANNNAGTSLGFGCNWWGDHTGPYHPTTNPSGLGDAVSTNVDFDPWIGITELSGPTDPVKLGDPASIYLSFTCNKGTATLEWGDETPVISYSSESETKTESHTYSAAGVYTVTLTIEDCCGRSYSRKFRYVVVYDPSDGFVTGGGWIDSPPGAHVANSNDPGGKANFGFVSKYKKGQPTPTGNTEFQFKAGDLNFHSDSYDWLVIAGHKAMYKGTGTINDAGNYGFMLSAIDEKLTPSTDVDMFRIKIWDKDDGDAVVYDNNIGNDDDADPTTEIAGGQIVIHKAK